MTARDSGGQGCDDPRPMAGPPNRIKELREALGLSLEDLAARVGSDHTTVWKLERGKRRLTAEWMARLAPHLKTTPQGLVRGWDPGEQNVRPALAVSVPERDDMPRDVPVFGTAQGGAEGVFLLNTGEAIDYVRRLPGIARVRNAFALYMEGDSMAPWRQAGQIVFVNPDRPARIGDHVVVVLQDGGETDRPAIVKKLVKRTAGALTLAAYNPEVEFEVTTDRVAQVWRVMELDELIGV